MGRRRRNRGKWRKKVFTTVRVLFICSRKSCRRGWTSIHSWRQCDECCDDCGNEAVIVEIKDHKQYLDNFDCPSCGKFWQSIHDDDEEYRQCCCGDYVFGDVEEKKKFGRHYWWECREGCDLSWERFNTKCEFSQRCTTCYSRGNILRLVKSNKSEKQNDDKDDDRSHQASHCDMCQYLIRSGRASRCTNTNQVECRVKKHGG